MPTVPTPPPPPRGNWYQTSALATAQAWAAKVDAQQGYPRAGVFAAPGPLQPATPFVTTTYQDIIAHPTLQQWAYPSDPVIDPVLAGTNSLPTAAALTQDWSGTQPVTAPLLARAFTAVKNFVKEVFA